MYLLLVASNELMAWWLVMVDWCLYIFVMDGGRSRAYIAQGC